MSGAPRTRPSRGAVARRGRAAVARPLHVTATPPPPRAEFAVLDVLLKHQSASVYKKIGDSYFGKQRDKSYYHRKAWAKARQNETWVGYKLTVVQTVKGPMMQIDHGATACLAPIQLEQFIVQKLNLRGDLRFSDLGGGRASR